MEPTSMKIEFEVDGKMIKLEAEEYKSIHRELKRLFSDKYKEYKLNVINTVNKLD